MKYLLIEADTHDGNLITELSKVTDEQLVKFAPIIKAIKNFKPYTIKGNYHERNFPLGDAVAEHYYEMDAYEYYKLQNVDEELFDDFVDFVPYPEHGIHTITRIEVYEVSSIKKLLKE